MCFVTSSLASLMIINSILPTTLKVLTKNVLILSKFIMIKLRNILIKLFSFASSLVIFFFFCCNYKQIHTFSYHTLIIFPFFLLFYP